MCRIFAGIPLEAYESETRSIRLAGHSTSIRLEAAYWQVLEELALAQSMPLSRFLTTLHDEVLELHGDVRNFASLLRCACLVHLETLAGRPRDRLARQPAVPAAEARRLSLVR